MEPLKDYDLSVIEPMEFTTRQISNLHSSGKKIYAYINVGALEEYRPYFNQFKDITLSVYEDWPDERWVDVSSQFWQDFIINKLGKDYSAMGFDGFFLDNTDVYYHYPDEEIFQGLCNILSGLKKYNIPLIINGGDTFVSECIDKKISSNLFDGINQESVFTGTISSDEARNYYKKYLNKVKENNLTVYILEYNADDALAKQIEKYCNENGFIWYNAKNKELK